MSLDPSRLKYASAFSPPSVSCRMEPKKRSSGWASMVRGMSPDAAAVESGAESVFPPQARIGMVSAAAAKLRKDMRTPRGATEAGCGVRELSMRMEERTGGWRSVGPNALVPGWCERATGDTEHSPTPTARPNRSVQRAWYGESNGPPGNKDGRSCQLSSLSCRQA